MAVNTIQNTIDHGTYGTDAANFKGLQDYY